MWAGWLISGILALSGLLYFWLRAEKTAQQAVTIKELEEQIRQKDRVIQAQRKQISAMKVREKLKDAKEAEKVITVPDAIKFLRGGVRN